MTVEISPSSSHFVHSNDPSLKLVEPPLNQNNNNSWSRAMRLVLTTKKKFGFVDGSILIPMLDDPRLLLGTNAILLL